MVTGADADRPILPTKNWIIADWLRHERKGHRLDSLYPIRHSAPMGMTELGVHTGCRECDAERDNDARAR